MAYRRIHLTAPDGRTEAFWCRDRCRKNAYDRRAYARKVQAQGRVYRPRPMSERGWAKALLQDERPAGD